jgi:arabinan endo-1,5-alpha-L-arabinosidase
VQNSIDPFYIEDNGSKYLFWGSFRGIYGIELSDDGLSVKPGAEKVQIAGTLTEGTYICKHDGYYYLFGSAGTCCEGLQSTYRVVVARSENLMGPYVNKSGAKALENNFTPLLNKSNRVVGPGHNSEIVQDDAGQYWMLYHGFDADDPDAGRKVYLDQLTWDKAGWPQIRNRQPSTQAEAPRFGEEAAVQRTAADPTAGKVYYDLGGLPTGNPTQGIFVEQLADGSARKVAFR